GRQSLPETLCQLQRIAVRRLGGAEQRRTNGSRHVDLHEPVSREEVILATFIDYPQLTVTFGILVRNDDVDLVLLEGRRVACVTDADHEPAVLSRGTAWLCVPSCRSHALHHR